MGICEMTFCEKTLPTFGWLLRCVILPDALCVHCRSPAGMIEGTPQLHANAWKISSACVAPVNQPIMDPCELNQNNGKSGHTLVFKYIPLLSESDAILFFVIFNVLSISLNFLD